MTRNERSGRRRAKDHRIRIRSVRRNPPDLKKLAGALIELAQAQAEADAAAQDDTRLQGSRPPVESGHLPRGGVPYDDQPEDDGSQATGDHP